MPEPLDITLYIPCYNGERFLDETLPAVRSQTYPIAEILVIDDGSLDGSAAVARRHGLRVVSHGENRGLGAARNTGVSQARTAWVASLDADVRPEPEWLEHLAHAVQGGRYAGAGGQLRETRLRSLADRWRNAHMRQWWGEGRVVNPDFLFGSNSLFLCAALLQAGGYDARCRTNGEDVDMSARLRAAGQELVYDPRAICEHLREDSIDSVALTYWNWLYYPAVRATPDAFEIEKARTESREVMRGMLERDLREGRWSLALVDVCVQIKWSGYRRRLKPSSGQR